MPSVRVTDPYTVRPVALPEVGQYHPSQDTFDFRRTLLGLIRSIRNHLLLIAATTMVTLGVVIAYVMIWPPVFTADVLLAVESDKDAQRNEFYNNWNVFRKNQLNDEVQLFTAPTVLTRVVDRLGLTYDEVYHPFMSHVTYLWMSSTVGKTYRRAKEWLFPSVKNPYSPTEAEVDRFRTIADFRAGISVESANDSSVGRLVVRGPTPRVAQIANTLVDVILELRVERQKREADRAYEALSVEVARAREDLRGAESRMEQYYTENQLVLAMEKDKLDVTRASALRAQITEIESGLASATRTLAEIDTQLSNEQKEVVASRLVRLSPIREALADKLSQMTLQRRQVLIHYRADSPEVRDLDRQIAAVRDQMAREPADQVAQSNLMLSDAYENLRRRKAALEADIAGQKAALDVKRAEEERLAVTLAAIPQKMKASHEFERERHMLEKRYTTLLDKLMIAEVSRAMASAAPSTIQVIDPATPPDKQSWPNTKLLLAAGAGAGILAGIGLAVLLDLMSGRVDRFRLAGGDAGMDLYAILPPERRFAAQMFPVSLPRGGDAPTSGGA
jgi:uncharacterized protein involved in exopolysaccharide biosynthesis